MQASTVAIAVTVTVIVAAIVALIAAYLHYRAKTRELEAAERRNIMTRGRIDLEQRFVRPDGSLRPASFDPSTPPRVVSPDPADANKPTGTAHAVGEMLRSGKLVQTLGRLVSYGQTMKERIDERLRADETDDDRLARAVYERCGDEAAHPLFERRWREYQERKRARAAESAASADDDTTADAGHETDDAPPNERADNLA